jgi:hypothetical protein
MGQVHSGALTFYSDRDRVLRLYSSHHSLLQFIPPYNEDVQVEEHAQNQFLFNVFTVIEVPHQLNRSSWTRES